LLKGLVHQASMALEAQALLEERTRQAELERELDIAATIQASLQPDSVRLAEGWQVAAVCRPARQVGGDFIAELPGPWDGHRAVAYGDVSGKSVSGALVMMAAYEILHSLALTAPHPEELVRLANRRLYEIQRGGFVALGYLSANPANDGLVYLMAGQPQPLKRCLTGEVVELPLGEHRLPLGAMMAEEHRLLEAAMEPGELVLGYSDGVVEATSPEGELFGCERLMAVLRESQPDPDEVVARVLAEVERFTRGNELYDDMTLVAVARRPEVAQCGS
jgi:serine phosphatase RsbU (regulator of sigma subunit)